MGYHKLASISFRYPKTIIFLWVMFFIFFGVYAPKLSAVLKDHGLTSNGAYVEVQHILSSDFHIPEDPIILVFENKSHLPPEPFNQLIKLSLLQLQGMKGLSNVISPLEREGMIKGDLAFAVLSFEHKSYEMKPVLEEVRRRLPDTKDILVRMTGKSAVQVDVNQASQHDLKQAEMIGLPAAFIILWYAFGGIVSAMIPIVIGVTGVIGTMGMMYWMGTRIELSNFVLNVIPMVGLALSIDFALIIVSRFREELESNASEQALIITMKTAGRAVLVSAASIFLGLIGVLFIPLPMFTTVAIGAITVLLVSVCAALTLLPALLTVLWPAIQAESRSLRDFGKTNIWYSIALYVMKRPVRMCLLASILLIGCLLPLSKMRLAIPDATSLPTGYESRMASEVYQAHFTPKDTSHVYMVLQGKSIHLNKDDWSKAYAVIQKLERDTNVKRVESVFSSFGMVPEPLYTRLQNPIIKKKYEAVLQQFVKGNRMLIHVTIQGTPASKNTMDWVRNWEREGESSDIQFLLGGESKYQQEVFDDIFLNIKYVCLFILVSNFVVLFIAFRSVLIVLKTIFMILLSLGASFGFLVWVFVEGNLGMEPTHIAVMIPVFIFGLAFGVSMDYGVFLVSRIFEVYRQTRDNERAVLVGLASTSRIITSAAAIMVAVTGPFAFGDVVGVQQLGIGIAAAILIDATLIRMVLVPSLMRLLGKWNWWAPKWLR
ncbi:MMPL family transporter [Paenibacillus sp. LMG 31456]|uniref:MMPL family transporter n=1 Tax=Paenibacillus foliorum TaxID=2654974 RepID=A0A972GM71_9BACL|nr:MMPL family transporter [Paenibacillus foliorum]NOU93289.1 MMPL family transporter [Paenibacillus foliorum]